MAIRYDKKLNQEINRTIKNFNQKIARLEKQEKELLPSKITKKELKESVYTRSELQRKLKELQRFSKRGAEDVITTRGGVRITKYELNEIKRENARLKRNITREINRLKVNKPKILGKIQTSTFSEMGDTDYLNLVARRKALEKDSKLIKDPKFNQLKEDMYLYFVRNTGSYITVYDLLSNSYNKIRDFIKSFSDVKKKYDNISETSEKAESKTLFVEFVSDIIKSSDIISVLETLHEFYYRNYKITY